MKIMLRYLKDQDYERRTFVDADSDNVYRRIYIGFAWPYLKKPGFICVMAEEDKQDFSIPYGPRHLRILAEHETDDIETFPGIYKSSLRIFVRRISSEMIKTLFAK